MFFGHITGTGSAVPERILSNADLETFIDTSDEWITRRSGIKERRIARVQADESTTDLAAKAARSAMDEAGVRAEDLDVIIVATVTADRPVPSAACMVQMALEANNATAYDISAGCSGFIYALEAANNAIRCGSAETILVIGSERLSSIVNWQDRSTCVLLGDGAGAVVLKKKAEAGGILTTHTRSDGRLWDLLYSEDTNTYLPDLLHDVDLKAFHLKMEGNRLFKQAVGHMATIAEQALRANKLGREDINLVIPHQANMRIIQAVSEKLDIPMTRFYTNLHKYGNTSAASIPIAMDEANRKALLKKDSHVLLVSFGAGLTWGSSIIRWTI